MKMVGLKVEKRVKSTAGDFYRARWETLFKALEEGMITTSAERFKREETWSRSKTIIKVAEEGRPWRLGRTLQ